MTESTFNASELSRTRNYARMFCDGRRNWMDGVGPTEAGTAKGDHPGGVNSTAILLIDDNAVQAATRQTILRRAGYFVIAVLNPVRALEQFQAQDFPAEIKLVITDHLMPGMTGAEFVTELRKTMPKMPVLVISGLEEAEELYGGLDVLFRMKPLLPDNLLASVHRLLWSEEN